jgi:hypothetical protein
MKICHSIIFPYSVMKSQTPLISRKNNGYFTRIPTYIYDHISLSSSENKNSDESCRENQNTRFNVELLFSPRKSSTVALLWYNVRGAIGLPLHPLLVSMIVGSCTETGFQLILVLFSVRSNLGVFLRLRTPVYYNLHFLFSMSRGSLFPQELGGYVSVKVKNSVLRNATRNLKTAKFRNTA